MSEVHTALRAARKVGPAAAAPVIPAPVIAEPAMPAEATRGVLHSRMFKREEAPAADAPVPPGKVSRKKLAGSLWSRLRSETVPAPGFMPGAGEEPVADPPLEPAVLKGSLTGPRRVVPPGDDPAGGASAGDKEDETTRGELKGSLLKKKE